MNAERDGLARGLLAGDTLDVNHVLETVDGSDLALLVLVAATDNGDLVVLADGDAADLFVGTRKSVLEGQKQSIHARCCGPGKEDMLIDVRCTSHGAPWREGRS